ncbi:Histidine protein methyltransferase 1 [Coemansia sp. RSA 1722]|nr:Histidine protein methyltransferase 1 [Coemansia sp. RSA 1722]
MLQSCDIRNRCEFIAGGWASIEHELRRQGREHSFDLVLTSETIYDTDSYKSLHDLLACVLARPQAETNSLNQQVPAVLVAAKSIYFGLTGSVLTFKQYVGARGVFDVDSVWQSGGSMPREILRLTWK